jgi:lipoprotein signal peptidase
MNKRDAGLLVAGATFALDQASKMTLLYGFDFIHMIPGSAVEVLPFFNLLMVWNPGISLGLFPASSIEGTIFLATFQMVAVGVLCWWLWFAKKPVIAIGLGMVIGGALGNLIDRLVYGKVADFIQLHAFGYSFYVFNVADAAITFGVVALLYDALKPEPSAAPGSGQGQEKQE